MKKSSWIHKIQEFRKIQLILIYFNSCKTWMLIPKLFLTLIATTISLTFGSIRLFGKMNFFAYITFPVIALSCFILLILYHVVASSVHATSDQLYKSFRHLRLKNKVFKKEIVSLQPFGVQVGLVRCLQKISLLPLLLFMSNYLETFLVAFPSSMFNQKY